MAYSKEVLQRARQRLESAKADRESENRQRLQQAYEQIPRLKEIDLQLRRTMTMAAQTVFTQGGDAHAAMEEVRQANLALQKERKLLVETHFEPGYLDETPICTYCGGTGYVGSTMCSCLQQLCRQEQKKELRFLSATDADFDLFRLDYYSEEVIRELGVSPRTVMEKVFTTCRKYAYSFGAGSGNLLFCGGTGLGKTYLSACIASVVADRGYSVVYESANNLFAKLEKHRFHPDEESRREVARLMECDLLILDDLGTELSGSFTISALYSLLNDRLMSGKAMIVSTNYSMDELAKRYNVQIASRLRGEFKPLVFVGSDIRILKNGGR